VISLAAAKTMKIENKSIKDLIQAEYNPRQLSKEQFNTLKDSLVEFGFVDPIIINSNPKRKNIIIGGHQRVKVAKEIGIKEVPCFKINLSLDKEKELNVRLNKNTGDWDWDLLANNFDVESLLEWGFTEEDLQFEAPKKEGLTDDDDVPEVKEPICKEGDLWQLGEHRLLCGDATKEEDVELLMNGEKADMVFTDPPYGMNAVKNSGVLKDKYKDILNDDSINTAVKSFHLIDYDIPSIWWGANYYANALPNKSCWLVWDKNNGGSDQMDCELAWTNIKGVVRKYTKASEKKNRVHPTQKPIELIEWCFKKIRSINVYDPFLGSGSTLIACEKTDRKCYGLELDPHYCDVIIKRWEEYTGGKAEKI